MDKQFPTSDTFELTPIQKSIWYGQMLNTELPVYNVAYVFNIDGALDIDSFVKAHATLVSTTDSLRTVIKQEGDWPKQRTLNDAPNSLKLTDSSSLKKDDFNKRIEEASKQSIDLEQCPWTSTLHRRAANQHSWHFIHHHLFTDGYSFHLLIRRLAKIYQDTLESEVEKPEDAFPSFAQWAQKSRHAPHFEKREQPSQLKLYSSKTPTGKTTGERRSIRISSELNISISELIATPHYQSFTTELSQTLVLLTSVFALLNRIEQQSEIAIGFASHGRTSKEERNITGPLLHLGRMQVRAKQTDTFSTLYEKVREAFFKQASELSSPDALLSEPEDCGVTFSLISHESLSLGKTTVIPEWIYPGCHESVHLWRIHFITTLNGSLELLCDFNNEVFSQTSKQVATDNLLATIGAFTQDPKQTISGYTLIDQQAEYASILQASPREISPNTNLWKKFEAVAEKHASTTAVQTELKSWNYEEFKQLAEETSGMLNAHFIKKDNLIPIVGGRSAEMIQSALGTMRIGAAFLPIDSELPAKRIDTIINDSQAPFPLFLDKLPKPSQYPSCESKESKSAYVIYTSGSTGVPNGVVVGHLSVMNLLEDMESRAPLVQGSKCMWWTSVGFDVSIYEIFSTLLYGHTLYIPPENIRLDSKELFQWMYENEIASAYLPPFMLDAFDRWLDNHSAPPLRRLLVGVEPIQQNLLKSISRKIEKLQIVNGYGPTETTICATLYSVDQTSRSEGQTPIGTPVNGNSCYVLDKNLNVMPQGSIGELYIGGEGLSLGYWNRPKLQSLRFIPTPFCENNRSQVIYKTGDFVRINNEKQLIFIGRKDSQVKMRGHRIELSEIEQTMTLLNGIDRCSVAIQKNNEQDELICFYTGPDRVSDENLAAHATAYLPFQMQARKYIHLNELPVTLNGKIDVSALLKLNIESEKSLLVSPEGFVEEHVYQVWANILNVESFSVHDSLYSLGGSSLAAIDITHQLNRDFEIELSQQTIFQRFTVAKLSKTIEEILYSEISAISEEEAERILTGE